MKKEGGISVWWMGHKEKDVFFLQGVLSLAFPFLFQFGSSFRNLRFKIVFLKTRKQCRKCIYFLCSDHSPLPWNVNTLTKKKITSEKLWSYGRLKTDKESDDEKREINYIKWRGAVTHRLGHWG